MLEKSQNALGEVSEDVDKNTEFTEHSSNSNSKLFVREKPNSAPVAIARDDDDKFSSKNSLEVPNNDISKKSENTSEKLDIGQPKGQSQSPSNSNYKSDYSDKSNNYYYRKKMEEESVKQESVKNNSKDSNSKDTSDGHPVKKTLKEQLIHQQSSNSAANTNAKSGLTLTASDLINSANPNKNSANINASKVLPQINSQNSFNVAAVNSQHALALFEGKVEIYETLQGTMPFFRNLINGEFFLNVPGGRDGHFHAMPVMHIETTPLETRREVLDGLMFMEDVEPGERFVPRKKI